MIWVKDKPFMAQFSIGSLMFSTATNNPVHLLLVGSSPVIIVSSCLSIIILSIILSRQPVSSVYEHVTINIPACNQDCSRNLLVISFYFGMLIDAFYTRIRLPWTFLGLFVCSTQILPTLSTTIPFRCYYQSIYLCLCTSVVGELLVIICVWIESGRFWKTPWERGVRKFISHCLSSLSL